MGEDRIFRRAVVVEASSGRVQALVRDPFHHFTIDLRHDGAAVTSIAAEAIRVPWTTCPGAVAALDALRGTPIGRAATGTGRGIDAAQHCTHLLDLAKLAIAQAARGGARRYAIAIAPADGSGPLHATIARDGAESLAWVVEGDRIVAPAAFAGHLLQGRAIWPEGAIADADMLEAALILRRALLVQRGAVRLYRLDPERATAFPRMAGSCFTFQPDRMADAARAVPSFLSAE